MVGGASYEILVVSCALPLNNLTVPFQNSLTLMLLFFVPRSWGFFFCCRSQSRSPISIMLGGSNYTVEGTLNVKVIVKENGIGVQRTYAGRSSLPFPWRLYSLKKKLILLFSFQGQLCSLYLNLVRLVVTWEVAMTTKYPKYSPVSEA